jgi:hypothetical protein
MEADRRPGVWAWMLGSMLQKTREVVGLSYDQAAVRLGGESDWLVRVEIGFAVAAPARSPGSSWNTACATPRSPTR